jgi:hypothetical protein
MYSLRWGAEVVALDGKTSRRSGKEDASALHLVSAFAAGAGLVLGQTAIAKKSNEKTVIPGLLQTLALEGCVVTTDAMDTQPNHSFWCQCTDSFPFSPCFVIISHFLHDAMRLTHAVFIPFR